MSDDGTRALSRIPRSVMVVVKLFGNLKCAVELAARLGRGMARSSVAVLHAQQPIVNEGLELRFGDLLGALLDPLRHDTIEDEH